MQDNRLNLYEDRSEAQSVQFWLFETAQNLTTYGPTGTTWTVLVPSIMQQYDSVRHLVLATAMLDQSMGFSTIPSTLKAKAFHHYQAAISAMINTQHPRSIIVVASLIAWMFETMLGQWSTATVHVRAASKLIEENQDNSLEFSYSDRQMIEYSLKSCVRLAEGYSQTMFNGHSCKEAYVDEPPRVQNTSVQQLSIKSLCQAQKMVESEIEQFCSKSFTLEEAGKFRVWLSKWQMAIMAYRRCGPESFLQKRSTHLFFNLAMALLPAREAGAFSQESNETPVKHILTMVKRLRDEALKPCRDDRKLILGSLRSLLYILFRNFPQAANILQGKELLTWFSANSDLCAK